MIVLLQPQGFKDIPRKKITQILPSRYVTQVVSRLDCSVNISDPQNFGRSFFPKTKTSEIFASNER